jgi:hypothetical protein
MLIFSIAGIKKVTLIAFLAFDAVQNVFAFNGNDIAKARSRLMVARKRPDAIPAV